MLPVTGYLRDLFSEPARGHVGGHPVQVAARR